MMKPNLFASALALMLAAGSAEAQVKLAHDCPPDPATCGT